VRPTLTEWPCSITPLAAQPADTLFLSSPPLPSNTPPNAPNTHPSPLSPPSPLSKSTIKKIMSSKSAKPTRQISTLQPHRTDDTMRDKDEEPMISDALPPPPNNHLDPPTPSTTHKQHNSTTKSNVNSATPVGGAAASTGPALAAATTTTSSAEITGRPLAGAAKNKDDTERPSDESQKSTTSNLASPKLGNGGLTATVEKDGLPSYRLGLVHKVVKMSSAYLYTWFYFPKFPSERIFNGRADDLRFCLSFVVQMSMLRYREKPSLSSLWRL
jgi:hypothetical protein